MTKNESKLGLPVAAILLATAIFAVLILGMPNDEDGEEELPEVFVISIDFDGDPLLLWSNQKATQRDDGTIEITTRGQEDF